MELQILHAIQDPSEWLTEILRFYYDGRKRSGMDRYCDCADLYTEDPEMRPDDDDRHGRYYLVGNLFLKNVIARPRPCAVDTSVILKIPFPSEYSFPSGHSSNGFAGAVTIFSYYRKAGILSAHGGSDHFPDSISSCTTPRTFWVAWYWEHWMQYWRFT